MAKIKYGQIGVGHAHANKLNVYRASSDYEVVGIVEPNEQLRRRAAETSTYEGLPWMTTEQLLNLPELQVVGVETHVRDLLPTAEQCIAAGKHIHLDKPAGVDLARFHRLLNEAASKHLAVQMGYMYRYNPGVLLLRDFLSRGWLGEPFELHTVMSKVVPAPARKPLAEFSGGIMFELGCHLLDLTVGILGKPTNVTAYHQHVAPTEDGLRDNMLAVLEYPQALATVKSSAVEVEGFARRHLVVCGTEGTFHLQPLDNPRARVAFSQPRGKYSKGYQDIELPKFTRYVADAADLARIVRDEKDADYSYEHDLIVQETLLQASGMS